jgi:hypothetical protein
MGVTSNREVELHPGAPGHGRTQSLAMREERHHHPEVCAACYNPLSVIDI